METRSAEMRRAASSAGHEAPDRQLWDACPEAIIVIDAAGFIVDINEAAARRHAKPADELKGASIWNLYATGQSAQRKTVVSKVLSSGQPIHFTEQQGDRWDEVLISPLGGAPAQSGCAAIFTRDVTRQIRAEERLKLASLQLLTIQEDERRRIAQDLHDDLGQAMTALILDLKAAHSQVVAGRGQAAEQLEQTIRTVEDMMRHIRQVFYELRPPSFAAAPLAKVLETLCASLALSTGLRIVFSSQEQLPPIPDAQATAFYRLVQEGINNVAKHARAASVWINLECAEGEINLSLEDDGQGFEPLRLGQEGMGLQGIRDRFSLLGGSFDLEAAPGRGARLYASLPLREAAP
jgi:two-component system sensor histidine kinase UhpB